MESIISAKDKRYPILLKKISDFPKKLYYKGNWEPEIFENCLAVVGSRRMTSYGRQATEKLIREVAAAGVTIVSGFMYGIDATAHKAALEGGGRTIAVMPCGANIVHPAYQGKLYRDILENRGLIISEFEPDFPPANWTYPKRNRIVAGLSKAVLVMEAASKSGALITADFAKKYKRKLFALPGPVTSKTSEGTNWLLKEGAAPVTDSRDILNFFGVKTANLTRAFCKTANGLEAKILEVLKREPMEIDELSRMFGISSAQLGTALSFMAMQGLIFQEGRKYYPK